MPSLGGSQNRSQRGEVDLRLQESPQKPSSSYLSITCKEVVVLWQALSHFQTPSDSTHTMRLSNKASQVHETSHLYFTKHPRCMLSGLSTSSKSTGISKAEIHLGCPCCLQRGHPLCCLWEICHYLRCLAAVPRMPQQLSDGSPATHGQTVAVLAWVDCS